MISKIYWRLKNKGSPEVVEAFKKMPTYKHFSPAEERILLEILFAFREFSLIVIKHHELAFTGYWSVSLWDFQTVRCVSSREVIYISSFIHLEYCTATQDNSFQLVQKPTRIKAKLVPLQSIPHPHPSHKGILFCPKLTYRMWAKPVRKYWRR